MHDDATAIAEHSATLVVEIWFDIREDVNNLSILYNVKSSLDNVHEVYKEIQLLLVIFSTILIDCFIP